MAAAFKPINNISGRPVTVHGDRLIGRPVPAVARTTRKEELLVHEPGQTRHHEQDHHHRDNYIHKVGTERYMVFARTNVRGSQPVSTPLISSRGAKGPTKRPHTITGRGRNRAMRYRFLKYLLENEGEQDDLEFELEAIKEGEVSARPGSITGSISRAGRRFTQGRLSSRVMTTARAESRADSMADSQDTDGAKEQTMGKRTRRKGLWKKLSVNSLKQLEKSPDELPSDRSISASSEGRGGFSSLISRIRKKSRIRKGQAETPDLDLLAEMAAIDAMHPGETPMARFRRAARLVQLILTAITSTRRENIRREAKLMSFYQLQDELGTTKGRYGDGLDFDPNYYKACRQIQISDQAKQILMMDPKDRVDEQRHIALVSLNQAVDAFGEFPIKMQQSLVRRGWYEHFEAKRVIIRQGHFAENFYFILSGTAVVTILSTNKKTGETSHNTVAFLKKGNSFGELALMYGGTRNATVTCKDDVELLAVGRDDFVDIFMHVDKDVEPDHIQFLRLIDIFDGWPIGTLPYADPKTCLFTYFRRGVIMCRDSINNEWIYVVKTGSCRVLKALQPVKADMQTIPLELRGSTSSLATPTNSPRKSETQEKQLFSSNRYLPPLKAIDYEAARESRLQHQAKIEKLYEERHKTQQRRVQFEKAKVKPLPNAKVYVQIQKLGPKETFGLTSIAFQMMEEPLSLILVSDGAECVLINKKFFLQHLSEGHHKYLRTSVQPYPTEDHLQQKLQDQVNWEAYKAVTFQNEIVYKKKLHDTLEL
ncbi:uncharacterized protein LOC135493189 isoform X2 [Lineus longissimus]|uniref:uncharacterized protein LOC135493189 isoform X2 n=1 Tax=Lineus longissimus TaxID=88925 RepID=UPI00315DEC27